MPSALKAHVVPLTVLAFLCGWFSLVPALRGQVVLDAGFIGRFLPWRIEKPQPLPPLLPGLSSLATPSGGLEMYGPYWATLLQPDTFLTVYPAHRAAREQLRDGHLPLWDDMQLTGAPFMANGMVQPFTPFLWVASALPLWTGWNIMLFLQLFACAAAAYAFLCGRGATRSGATAGAVLVAFAPATFAFFPYGNVIGGWAFALLALHAIEKVMSRRHPWWSVLLAVGVAGQFLAAHIQFGLYAGILQTLWTVRLALLRPDGRLAAMLRTAGVAAIGLLLACVQVVPVLELFSYSARDPVKYANANQLDPRILLDVVFPRLYGEPASGSYVGGCLFGLHAAGAEMLALGVVAFLLAVTGVAAGRRFRPDTRFWLVLATVFPAVLTLASIEPIGALLGALPLFSSLQATRFFALANVAAAVLAASGVDALVSGASDAATRRHALRALGGAAALVGVAAVSLFVWSKASSGPLGQWLALAGTTFTIEPVVLAGVLIASVVLVPRIRGGSLAGVPAVALVIFETFRLVSPRLPLADPAIAYGDLPSVNALRAEAQRAPGRFLGLTEDDTFPAYHGDNLPPNTVSMFGLEDVRGYIPLPSVFQESLLAVVANPENPTHFLGSVNFRDASSPWFDAAAVRWAMTMTRRAPLPPKWRLAHDGPIQIWENRAARDRVRFVPCAVIADSIEATLAALGGRDAVRSVVVGSDSGIVAGCRGGAGVPVRVTASRPGHLQAHVDAPPGGGFVVVADAYFPGWEATVNGSPAEIHLADGMLRVVEVPAGAVEVTMTYAPLSLELGGRLSLVGLVLLAAIVLFDRGRAR